MCPSGLITQYELQQFADRPAGLPWAPHRASSDHVPGCEDVYGVESGLGFSVVLHELQVNAVPRAGGLFPRKKVKNSKWSSAAREKSAKWQHGKRYSKVPRVV